MKNLKNQNRNSYINNFIHFNNWIIRVVDGDLNDYLTLCGMMVSFLEDRGEKSLKTIVPFKKGEFMDFVELKK